MNIKATGGIRFVLDAIIPRSSDGTMPGLSDLDFLEHIVNSRQSESLEHLMRSLDREAGVIAGRGFSELGDDDKSRVLEKIRKSDSSAFNRMATLALQYYYQTPRVLKLIGIEHIPYFPEGHHLLDGDFTLLETVYERGYIFR